MRLRTLISFALLLTAAIVIPLGARAAEPYGQPPLGPRAIGLGGAYTALADDASALHWNPAGLTGLGRQEVAVSHAGLHGGDLRDDHVALAVPLSMKQALALGWYRSGLADAELDFAENRADLAYAFRPVSKLSLGATAKFLTRSTGLENLEVQAGRGFGMDLGLLFTPARRLRAGLVAQNLFGTRLHYSGTDGSEQIYDPVIRAGLAFQIRPWLLAALDLDDRLHVGAEIAPRNELALRAGFQDAPGDGVGPVLAVGAGVRIGGLRVDVAREMHPDLGTTYHAGLAYGFQLNPSRVRVEKVEAEDLYAPLARSYATHPFGRAWIRNLADEEIQARVTVNVPGVLSTPFEREVLLRPRVLNPVDLTAVFPDGVVSRPGDREVKVEITASYRSATVVRSDRGSGHAALYGAGAVNWARGVDQVGAFVTTGDPVVDGLARQAVRGLGAEERGCLGTREMMATAAIVTALSTLEFRYIPDPHNPYSDVSEDKHAVDNVRYPRETLDHRSGDCDDTVVLLASLLENVGVATQVVDVPGHLFLLADSGLRSSNREALLVDSTWVLVRDDRVWIPLETTQIGGGFREVWAAGVRTYRSWEALGRMRLVDVAAARRRYESMESALPSAAAVPIDVGRLRAELTRLGAEHRAAQEAYLEGRHGRALASPEAPVMERMAAAKALYLSGRWDQARALLEVIRARTPSPQADNNLAVVLLGLADNTRAGQLFMSALQASPEDPGIWLNLGLLRFLEGDMPAARTAVSRAMSIQGGREEVSSRLETGSAPERTRGAGIEFTLDKFRALILSVLGATESEAAVVSPSATVADTTGAAPTAAGTAAGPAAGSTPGTAASPAAPETLSPSLDLIMITARADEPARVQHFFYWKDR